MAHSLASLLALAAVAQGFETFEIKCTGPSTTVGFVSSADKRGTVDILLSCLFTIIACTWTVQHLNVPEQREGHNPGWLGNIKWTMKRAWTNTKWMLITVLAPELLLAKNLADLSAVNENLARLQSFAEKDGVPWTRVHSLFANMGGFVIRVNFDSTSLETSKTSQPSQMAHSNPYHLIAADILALREADVLEKLPSISEEELNDKSKSDSLVRVIAVVQIVWMVVQIIVRASRHLAISQLEVSVLAFASCAIFIYGLNWEKPKGVQVPFTLLKYQENVPPSVLLHVAGVRTHSTVTDLLNYYVGILVKLFGKRERSQLGGPVRNHASQIGRGMYDFVGLTICSVIFGSIHVVAWNFVFPTLVERTMWRVCSILCTVPMLVFSVLAAILGSLEELNVPTALSSSVQVVSTVLLLPTFFLYVVARLFLIVETLRTLFFLPPSAYIATWASNVPHIT